MEATIQYKYNPARTWMQMALDDSLTEEQRLKLAVYEYPLNDHYNKVTSSKLIRITDHKHWGPVQHHHHHTKLVIGA